MSSSKRRAILLASLAAIAVICVLGALALTSALAAQHTPSPGAGTEVRARLAGPSARLRGDHCDSHAVSDVTRPIWLAA